MVFTSFLHSNFTDKSMYIKYVSVSVSVKKQNPNQKQKKKKSITWLTN